MKVTIEIELVAGPESYRQRPTKKIMDRNIESLERVLQGRLLTAVDTNYLIDTKSILMAIKKQLPE